jgi:hypothetical protein
VVAVFLAVVTIAGIAYAAWTATGTGSGNAKTLTAATVTVNAIAGAADLYPGGPAGAVDFTLTNTNPYSITFDTVSAATVSAVSGGIADPGAACAPSDLMVAVMPYTGWTAQVAAGSPGSPTTSPTRSVPGLVSMRSTAPSNCQNAVFTITLTLTGSQD